jgi:hypothetical protein
VVRSPTAEALLDLIKDRPFAIVQGDVEDILFLPPGEFAEYVNRILSRAARAWADRFF